ncbi:hypothetical protein BpHYR1_014917 [Brachionus plicatilis]|uniref:Uncharacterized protein n=1 Tax=Brachionus plicatilis TaxID=10195 RepID=A0A3M7RA28_BRAPC|nr:hypothetical protein BpHYR1_014917 [Brachionus plicatilis]
MLLNESFLTNKQKKFCLYNQILVETETLLVKLYSPIVLISKKRFNIKKLLRSILIIGRLLGHMK